VPASGHALKILVKIMLQRTEMTPFGLINMSSNGKAITNLTWLETKPETATDPKTGNKDHHNSDAILDQAFQELHEYANGTRQIFTVPVSLDHLTPALREWLNVLRQVAYGDTISYADLAIRAGKPRAARSAGSACANNPVPIIYPCHRITRLGGKLGNFGAIRTLSPMDQRNLGIKAALIAHEKTWRAKTA
jgi:methylated-DNA-[protein]-cysteine S-methyltransferase